MAPKAMRAFVDWSVARIPEQDLRSARLLSSGSLVLGLGGFGWLPFGIVYDTVAGCVIALISSVVMCSIPLLLRMTRSTFLGGQAFLAVGLIGLAGHAWRVGGDGHEAFIALPVFAAAAFMLLGRRTGITWTIMIVALVGVFYGLNAVGLTPPIHEQIVGKSILDMAGVVLVVVCVAAIVMVADGEQRRARDAANAANQDLVVARDRALLASRAKTDFLANMSHEIRTPMNGVLGLTGLLLDTELNADQRDLARLAHRSGEILLDVVNDILDFSKVEAGQLSLEPVPFDLVDLVEDVGELLRGRAAEKGIALIVRTSPSLPPSVRGDPGRLRQVLMNLAGNAIKFTERGHVLIDVDGAVDGDQASIAIRVEDTGAGIPADKISMIFEKFTQADSSTTRRFGGTGLGLAIVDELVALMGGTIEVTSAPGVGSTFLVRIALPTSEQTGLATPVVPASSLRDVRVLIVDDNAINRRVVHERIIAWGMRNGRFASGAAALSALREANDAGDPYEIAIIDNQMPGMDGEEVARAIRADPALRGMALVMLTSVTAPGLAQRMLSAGFDQFVVKPAKASRLMDALVTAFALRFGDRRVAAPATIAAARATVSSARSEDMRRVRVLVAEDNVVNQKVAVRMLERFGCRVDVAADGKEAVDLVSRLPYDLVFMDCQMPVMDGYVATAAIRSAQGSAREVPIIALTAHVMAEERERCLLSGMNDHLAKPISQDALRAMIDRWLPADLLCEAVERLPCARSDAAKRTAAEVPSMEHRHRAG